MFTDLSLRAVLRIRINRIRMSLGFPDPHQDQLVRVTDSVPDPVLDPVPNPSIMIIKQK
jgi:hypothetical protein